MFFLVVLGYLPVPSERHPLTRQLIRRWHLTPLDFPVVGFAKIAKKSRRRIRTREWSALATAPPVPRDFIRQLYVPPKFSNFGRDKLAGQGVWRGSVTDNNDQW